MYHRFPSAQGLEAQCRHLRDCYQPLALTEAADSLKSGRPLPPNSVAVTIDDGHRDFLEIAHPVFSKYRIPVTVYLVTGFVDGTLWLWADQVRYAFQHTRLPHFRQFTLASKEQRTRAAGETCEALKLLANADRLAELAQMPQLLEVEIPSKPPPGCEPLTWDEVRALARTSVEFGAHTQTHPVLSRVSSAPELDYEIAGSKRRIEEMLGVPVRHFCYPNGSNRDINPEAVAAVRSAGCLTAVTTESGLNSPGDDLFRLRRIGVDPAYDPDYFQACAAAFRV
ncbi:MAG: hypothetical protein C5B51_27640 [Terriglobia bacterium]|nr:MAG: hypothetical protein C5B51_27640 [Terriglobia bacterium]